jgi:CRISPR/Cas system CSM-associated protein Csm3 (group 7 of RAMP superfamily)
LFDTETIPPGTEFSLRVIAENLKEDEAKCLGQLMGYFAEGGIAVGGRSRAGLGRVTAKGMKFSISYMQKGQFMPHKVIFEDVTSETLADKLVESLPKKPKEAGNV